MLQTFSVYVHDRPGVLNRVASFFRRRGFNIESLTVGRTHRLGISRMTVAVDIAEERRHGFPCGSPVARTLVNIHDR